MSKKDTFQRPKLETLEGYNNHVEASVIAREIEVLKRELNLLTEQKNQSDHLVEVLSHRCDMLRQSLISERKSWEQKSLSEMKSLQENWVKEKRERTKLSEQLSKALEKIQQLEFNLENEKRVADNYKKIAQEAILEVKHTVSQLEDNYV